jgi:hypothetical protein
MTNELSVPVACGSTLFFCRTPLQALIVNHLLETVQGEAVVIYHPTSANQKHLYYFHKIATSSKHFIPWRPLRASDTLTDLAAWWKIPIHVRRTKYARLFLASIGSVPFSLFARANPDAKIHTFDDGTFNLNEKTFLNWIDAEPIARRLLKRMLRCPNNVDIVERAVRHHTIFPKRYVVGIRSPIEEIMLFENFDCRRGMSRAPKVRVLLGTRFGEIDLQDRHDRIVESGRFDVVLPHLVDVRLPIIGTWLLEAGLGVDPAKAIAEDVVAALVTAGFRPVVYGFNSTALLNLARLVPTVSIFLAPHLETIPAQVMSDLGVRRMQCYGLAANTHLIVEGSVA